MSAVGGDGVFGSVVDVGQDVEEAVELEEVEEAFDDAGRAGQDDGCVGFVAERGDGLEQGSDTGAVEEGGRAEVDHEVAMATGDLALDRFLQPRRVGEVEFARDSHVRPVRAERFGRHRGLLCVKG